MKALRRAAARASEQAVVDGLAEARIRIVRRVAQHQRDVRRFIADTSSTCPSASS